jgi:hypothetical protein
MSRYRAQHGEALGRWLDAVFAQQFQGCAHGVHPTLLLDSVKYLTHSTLRFH